MHLLMHMCPCRYLYWREEKEEDDSASLLPASSASHHHSLGRQRSVTKVMAAMALQTTSPSTTERSKGLSFELFSEELAELGGGLMKELRKV